MGVLYARVAGAWVPIGNGIVPFTPTGSDHSPAYIGPAASTPTDAILTNVGASGTIYGFNVEPDGVGKVHVPPNKQFIVWVRDAANTSYAAVLQVAYDKTFASGLMFGFHPQHGTQWDAIWSEYTRNTVNGSDYIILKNRASGQTLLNGWSGIELRVANAGRVIVQSNKVDINVPVNITSGDFNVTNNIGCYDMWVRNINGSGAINGASVYASGDINSAKHYWQQGGDPPPAWEQSQYVVAGAGYNGARISLNYSGAVVQLRVGQWLGNSLEAVDGQMNAYVTFSGSGFATVSTGTVKRDVRSIYPERERITVKRDPWSDTVDPPDVMSLRPVAFRPKRSAMRWNPDTKEMEPDDHPVWSHEGRRERLGLIAEEVETVLPSAVGHNMNGEVATIDYSQITVALLAHVQQLTETIATLQYRITELENAT